MRVRDGFIQGATALALIFALGCPSAQAPIKPESASDDGAQEGEVMEVKLFSDLFPVTSLAPSKGLLWVGTEGGLVRWDLAKGDFRKYDKSEGLASSRVTALATDGAGDLWIGTDKGVILHSHNAFQNFSEEGKMWSIETTALASNMQGVWLGTKTGLARYHGSAWAEVGTGYRVNALEVDPAGILWVATQGHGLLRFKGKESQAYDHKVGLPSINVASVAMVDNDLGLLIWTDTVGTRGLAMVVGSAVKKVTLKDSQGPVEAQAISRFGKGIVVVTSRGYAYMGPPQEPPPAQKPSVEMEMEGGGGLVSLPLPFEPQGAPRDATTMAPDEQGNLWFGTTNLGTARLSTQGEWKWFQQRDLLAAFHGLNTMTFEPGAVPWLTTANGLLAQYKSNRWWPITVATPPGSLMEAVASDSVGVMWAVHHLPGEPIFRFSKRVGLAFNQVGQVSIAAPEQGALMVRSLAIAQDRSFWMTLGYRDESGSVMSWGVVQVASDFGAVLHHRIPASKEELMPGVHILPNNVVTAMAFPLDGAVWLATEGGICKIKEARVETYSEANSMENEIVSDLQVGTDGKVYAATAGGVEVLEGGAWIPLPTKGVDSASALTVDSRNRLWVANEKGLFYYKDREWYKVTLVPELTIIQDLASDLKGRIWIGSDQGLGMIAGPGGSPF